MKLLNGLRIMCMFALTCGVLHAQTLYWVESTFPTPSIHKANTDGSSHTSSALTASSLPQGIATDNTSLYWAELAYTNARINKASSTFSGTQALISNGSVLRDIALDVSGSKMYWTSTNLATGSAISRANLDGSGPSVLIQYNVGGPEAPRGIALDVTGGKMYWADFDLGRIRRANLNGTTVEDLVTGLAGPAGLRLDVTGGKMYWTEANSQTIKSASLSGTGVTTLVTTTGTPNFLTLDITGGMMYWTEIGATPKIRKANLNGTNAADFPVTVNNPAGIVLFAPPPASPTATTVSSNLNPSFTTAPNNSVTLTATVTSIGNPVTAGTVTFTDGLATLGGPVPLNGSGQAALTTSLSTEGNHNITATYNGTANFNTSNGSLTQVVNNHTVINGNEFCNTGVLTINDNSAGTPYPSHIFVSGFNGTITKLTVELNGFTTTTPADVDLLLVGPGGQKFIIMSDAGASGTASNLNLVLDDAAAGSLPGILSSGTFKPTDNLPTDVFPSPAPAGPYTSPPPTGTATFATVFNGTDPNGTWSLYVVDDQVSGAGSFAGGWCLTITAPTCATNLVVTNSANAGAGSLRQAIIDACPGGTITFNMNSVVSPITLTSGEISIGKNLTIMGPGANLLSVSGNNNSRVFDISGGVTVTIDSLTVTGGNVTGNGGGILVDGSILNLNCSAVSNNQASGLGAGICIAPANFIGAANVTNSTISGNTTTSGGGGVFSGSDGSTCGVLTLTNSTVSANSAAYGGGLGAYCPGSGNITVTNSTISNNTAAANSGGGIFNQSSITLANSIVANSPLGGDCVNSGGTINAQYSLIEDGLGSINGTNSNNLTGDPILGALANNGGRTMTHALLPGSPAINTGTNTGAPAIDQRGIARPVQTTTDIGAYESRGFTMAVLGGDNQSTPVNTAFANPLAVTVSNSFSEPVDGGKVTFTAPATGASGVIAGNPATIAGGTAATGTVTANATAGGYQVTASSNGVTTGVNFSLTNTIKRDTIFASAGAHGSITPSGTVLVPHGTDTTFTFTPDAGYHVDSLIVDGVAQSVMAKALHGGSGANKPALTPEMFSGKTLRLTAQDIDRLATTAKSQSTPAIQGKDPQAGGPMGITAGPSSYTFTNVIQNHTITVKFAQDPFTDISAVLQGVTRSAIAWGDYDNDGDLDILLTGQSGSNFYSKIYRNDGNGVFTDINAGLTGVAFGSVAWGDYDNDGYIDILLTGANSSGAFSKVYHNNDNGTFTDINAGLTGVAYGSVAWGDYNNDGKLDILLSGDDGSNPVSKVYRNNGDGTFTDINAGLPGVLHGSVAWGDYNNDGKPDILLAGYDGTNFSSKVYRNNGNGTFTDINAGLTGTYQSSVAWGDFDNDGDLDILLTGLVGSDPFTQVYRNDAGTFTPITTSLPGIYEGSVAWGDYDNDGNMDILLAGRARQGGFDVPFAEVYRNEGPAGLNAWTFTPINSGVQGIRDGSVAWGDYNNDGKLDILLTGQSYPGPNLAIVYQNNAAITNSVPTAPSGLVATPLSGNRVALAWNASSDGSRPGGGKANLKGGKNIPASGGKTPTLDGQVLPVLSYNLRVGTAPGGINTLSPMADTAAGAHNGWRRIPKLGPQQALLDTLTLPPGHYYWSVQAIDAALAGGPFAAEGSFVNTPLTVVSTVPAVNGVFTLPGPLTLDVNFSEPVEPSSLQASDLLLSGIPGAFATSFTVLPGNTTVRFTISGISVEGSLTAGIIAGQITDQSGNPNAAFSGVYSVDFGTVAYPTPLQAVNPIGSLVYDPSVPGIINVPGDVDDFTLNLDPNQVISILVKPSGNGLQPQVVVFDPANSTIATATAGSPGANAAVLAVPVSSAGTYRFSVSGSGGTVGGYTIQVFLNATLEQEDRLGGTNNTLATAQDIASSFVTLQTSGANAQRGAVLGSIGSGVVGDQDWYSFQGTAGKRVSVAIKSLPLGPVHISLFDGIGNTLATGTSGATNLDNVISNFVIGVSGTYYVQVTGGQNTDYNLVVTRNAAFDIEDNNTMPTAQALPDSTGVLGAITDANADWFSVTLAGSQTVLDVETSTPGDGPGQFVNILNPKIELYNSANVLLASGVPLADGRNEKIQAPGLTAGGTYYIKVTGEDATTGEYFMSMRPLVPSDPSGIVSDDFNTATLKPFWTFINPGNPSAMSLVGTGTADARLRIQIPDGPSHDVWTSGNMAPRVMQSCNNIDFEVEVKFDGQMTSQYQIEGIIVEQDANTFLRFDFVKDNSGTRAFAAQFTGGSPTPRSDLPIASGNPSWMRVKRQGNTWTQSYSYDGVHFSVSATFDFTLNVSKIGPFVGNAGYPEGTAPAFTGLVDYFFSTASPIVPEDGVLSAPTITQQPANATVQTGQTATFTVAATGTIPLAYQWQKNSSDIGGATNPSYTTPPTSGADNGASFRCVVSNSIGTVTSNAAILTVTAVGNASGIVSDDFNAATLKPFWTYINPAAPSTLTLVGTGTQDARLSIAVPAGSAHDVWIGANNAPRIMQPMNNTDFEVEVKFEQPMSAGYQLEGVIVEQSPGNYLRFGFVHDFSNTRLFAASFTNNNPSVKHDINITGSIGSRAGGGTVIHDYLSETGTVAKGAKSSKSAENIVIPVSTKAGAENDAKTAASDGAVPVNTKGGPGNIGLASASTLYLRVKRTGNSWTEYYSTNGSDYFAAPAFTQALTASSVGPYIGNAGSTPSNAPAFTGLIDYFFNTATPISPEDGTPSAPSITSQPQDQTVGAGQAATFAIGVSGSTPLAFKWQKNNVDIPLATNPSYTTPSTTLGDDGTQFRCIVSNAAGTVTSNSAILHVTSVPNPSGIFSDDFHNPTLDNRWVATNPAPASSFSLVGSNTVNARLSISIPSGQPHDIWTGGNNAPRIMQPANNTDFEVEVKFEQTMTAAYQIEGILAQQDATNFVRFGFVKDNGNTRVFAASFVNGVPTTRTDINITQSNPMYVRVNRTGNSWLQTYSNDGTNFISVGPFTFPLTVSSVGLYAGNASLPSTPAPAFTMLADYFFNTAFPIVLEDGGPVPPLPGGLNGGSVAGMKVVPTEFSLGQNFPNPFNPSTTISYGLPEPANVTLKVYNMLGQEMAVLTQGEQAPGMFKTVWDGRNKDGNTVGSGVYLYRIVAIKADGKSFTSMGKMILMK